MRLVRMSAKKNSVQQAMKANTAAATMPGGPRTNTYSASYYLYTTGFTQFHLSNATAGSWIFLVLTVIVVIFLVRRLLKPEVA